MTSRLMSSPMTSPLTTSIMTSLPETSTLTSADDAELFPEQAMDDIWFYTVGILCSALCLLGMVCNAVSFLVWVSPEARTSACTPYFISLSVYDFLFDFTMLCTLCTAEIFHRVEKELAFLLFYDPSSAFFTSFMNVVTFGSVYTTAVLAADRCLAVLKPLKWPRLCSMKRTLGAQVCVLVWSVLASVPVALEGKLDYVYHSRRNETFLMFVETEYRSSYFHTQVYLLYLFPAVSFVIPVLSILITNVILIFTVRKRKNNDIGETKTSNARELNRLTLQVVVISLITLFSRCLYAVEYVWMAAEGTIFVDQCSFACAAVSAIGKVVLVINASVNLFCYLYFAQKFRTLFLTRCGGFAVCAKRCRRRRARTNRDSASNTTSLTLSVLSSLSLTSLGSLSSLGESSNVELKNCRQFDVENNG